MFSFTHGSFICTNCSLPLLVHSHPPPPPHAELQILKYSGGLSLDSSFTQMSTPPEILSRVQGLKIAFNWSIYLFSIFSPYLFPELTHNGSTLPRCSQAGNDLLFISNWIPPKQLTNQKKMVNMVIASDLTWKPFDDYNDCYINGEMI